MRKTLAEIALYRKKIEKSKSDDAPTDILGKKILDP